MDRRRATWDGYAILLLFTSSIILSTLTPYAILILVIVILIVIHQLLLRIIFRGPEKRSLPFSDENWDIIKAVNGNVDVYGFVNYQDEKSDMVVLIHGWQST